MPTTTYSFYINEAMQFCKPDGNHTPITERDWPCYRFGDKVVHHLTFPPGILEKDDVLWLGLDCDMLSGGCHGSMAHIAHTVTQDEATNQAVTLTLDTRWQKFLGEVNGKRKPVPCLLGLYIKAADAYITLAETQATAKPVVIQPGDADVELPEAIYYTKEEINAVMQRFEDEIGNAEEATSHAQTWAEGTDEQVEELGGEKSAKGHAAAAKGHAEAADQSKRDAVTAKDGAQTAEGHAQTWAEGTDEQVEELGGEKSAKGHAAAAKGHAEAADQSKRDAVTAKDGAQTAEGHAQTWAEGTDEQVEELGGEKSAKGYARQVSESVQTAEDLKDQTQAIYDSFLASAAEYHVGPADNYGVTANGTLLSFTWRDPADNNVVKWKCSRLIYKVGGFPANERDGIVLLDNTDRNAYQITPFTFDMLAVSNYYFAIFTQSTGGVWNTGDEAPRFTTDVLTWQTICMMTRAGTLLQYPGMAIGSVVDIQTNSLFPAMRWKLAHIDYKGTYEHIEDYMLDNTRHHNSIWIPNKLPCLGDSQTAMQVQFDAPEKSYGQTWDSVFLNGKAYYTVSGDTYTQLTAGTDYENGDSISDWQTDHGDIIYTKNHADRVSGGCNSWMMSNVRQGLNGRGSDLYTPQNEYDVQSSHSFYITGFLSGFSDGYLANIMPVRNKTARNTIAATSGGGGGGSDITLDTFWLPSMKEVYNTNINNIAEGYQFDYFKEVATTNADRIQYDESMTARIVWMRSAYVSNPRFVANITTSGASYNTIASNAYALLPVQCVA